MIRLSEPKKNLLALSRGKYTQYIISSHYQYTDSYILTIYGKIHLSATDFQSIRFISEKNIITNCLSQFHYGGITLTAKVQVFFQVYPR